MHSYSLENAEKFNWSSISGNLNAERISHLEKYLIGHTILDAGCGGGAYVEFLAQQGFQVVGVDKYEDFLAVARRKGNCRYIQGEITNLTFSDKYFDCTYCFDVLEHVDDLAAIKELARVTSKIIIITVPQKDDFFYKYGLTYITYRDPTHLRYYTEETLKQLCLSVNPSKVLILSEGRIPIQSIFSEIVRSKVQKEEAPNFFCSRITDTVLNICRQLSIFLIGKVNLKGYDLGLVAVVFM
jgi:ubiquinone/menaquinone biosynthesis C-methylase UbiE